CDVVPPHSPAWPAGAGMVGSFRQAPMKAHNPIARKRGRESNIRSRALELSRTQFARQTPCAVFTRHTLSNTAVLSLVESWLVTRKPRYTVRSTARVVLPTGTHVVPSVEAYPVIVDPARTSLRN